MNKESKIMISFICCLLSFIISLILCYYKLYESLIVFVPLTIIAGIWAIYNKFTYKASDEEIYNINLNKILKTYDPILVKTSTFPKLNNKSVLDVPEFNDLLDAQAETRKPIYFIKGTSSTAFFLIDEDVVLVHFFKINKGISSELEIELKKLELQSSLNLDAIKDFDKTVVLQTNDKSYKISPIRDKKEEKKDYKLELPKEEI